MSAFCGTPEYLAPELLLGQGYTKTVDWWTLGVLLYEMLTGLPPFYDENTNEMYRKILSEPLHFPSEDIVPPQAKSLLTKLLDRDPARRLGSNGAAEIKGHYFFNSIDWRKLLQRKYEPTFRPNVVSRLSLSAATQAKINDRPTPSTPPTSTVSSPRRRPPILTLTVRCSLKQCNSNLQAGPTIAPLLGWAMRVAASKIPRLAASAVRAEYERQSRTMSMSMITMRYDSQFTIVTRPFLRFIRLAVPSQRLACTLCEAFAWKNGRIVFNMS